MKWWFSPATLGLRAGETYHVALVFDGNGGQRVYINGRLSA